VDKRIEKREMAQRQQEDEESTSLLLPTTTNSLDSSYYQSTTTTHAEDPLLQQQSPSHSKEDEEDLLPLWDITCILSTAFSYGCIMTTLFLITLPVECERIEKSKMHIPKSVALGAFVTIAGITQLVSPLFGMLSDTFHPPAHHHLGQRLPYLCLGGILAVAGLLGQYVESYEKLWIRYGFGFFLHMIGLNIIYAMMITLIPDQVPHSQTGVANGILALLLVTGSLFGFGLFHVFLTEGRIQDMYGEQIMFVLV
jgi:MFS family permease